MGQEEVGGGVLLLKNWFWCSRTESVGLNSFLLVDTSKNLNRATEEYGEVDLS